MILVTGGAGFIGSVLIKELNKAGRTDIIVVDRLRDTTKWKNLASSKFEEYVHADEFLTEQYTDLHREISFIFHIGACSSTTEMNMDYLMVNNVDYSKSLYMLALERGIPFIYASSAATYGNGDLGYNDDHQTIPKLRPMNPYGYSKQLFDEWVLKQKEQPPVWFGLKYFNVFGPNEYHKEDMRSLVHKAYGQILDKGQVKLFKSHREGFKDGEQLRDFVYVVDIVMAMLEMMKCQNGSGIYNMGTGSERSFLDLVNATFDSMGKPRKVEFIDMPESIRSQYQYFTKANMAKFHQLLPQFKFRSLEDAVKDYVVNFLMKDNQYY